ncbi:hypothetical protein BKA70DRAFT_1061255, partial [Coprinopsis sp. MPI-PUGE-AT-0042]
MKAFFKALIGFDVTNHSTKVGVLGRPSAYYGCVEAQGRGTLHCHLLVWLEGSLDPDMLRQRLQADDTFKKEFIDYLGKCISTSVPHDPTPDVTPDRSKHHPCKLRPLDPSNATIDERQKDLHRLVEECQRHTHNATCYKYWKGPGYAKQYRFELDESNVRDKTSIDAETGEILYESLDGLVNHFHAAIIEAVRCNMDIKHIGSGTAAKAVVFYITDYISKSQLKAHVAYAALETAVRRLGEFDSVETDIEGRAKDVLQKCAFKLISHQELSGQQVASYLLGIGDCYASHSFKPFFWPYLNKFVGDLYPYSDKYDESNEDVFVRPT